MGFGDASISVKFAYANIACSAYAERFEPICSAKIAILCTFRWWKVQGSNL